MNFFNVGFTLCGLNFNLGWEINYLVRIIGTVFMLGGIKEIAAACPDEPKAAAMKKYRPVYLALLVLSVLGLAQSLLIRFDMTGKTAGNLLSLGAGLGCGVLVLCSQKKILDDLLDMEYLVNDRSLVAAAAKRWKKYAFFAVVSLAGDTGVRLLPPDSTVSAVFGTAEVFSRIIMYIELIMLAVSLNRVRMDHNAMHPVG